MLYHKGTPTNGTAPALLYGYGRYEICIDPTFSSMRLSLVDRGFVFAIAHVRGGGEMGRHWYEQGMALDIETREQLIETVRRFVREKCVPIEAKVSEEDRVPDSVIAEMRELGLFGLSIPTE